MKKIVTMVMIVSLLALCGCGGQSGADSGKTVSQIASSVPSFRVMSESVDDKGVLKTECCYMKANPPGVNKNPHLAWEPVEGATSYAVYMYDADAKNYLHWNLGQLTETVIPEGVMNNELMYIGPYPPSGTHHYEITVYALKEQPDFFEGKINDFTDVAVVEKAMDTAKEQSGNVVGVGVLKCTVTSGK